MSENGQQVPLAPSWSPSREFYYVGPQVGAGCAARKLRRCFPKLEAVAADLAIHRRGKHRRTLTLCGSESPSLLPRSKLPVGGP